MLKKLPSDKINVTKNAFFSLSRTPTHHSSTFNSQFLYHLKHRVYLSKTVSGIFHFRFRLVFIKLYIFIKSIYSLTLKPHNSFQNKQIRKVSHRFAPRPLIFKLQQEV